MNMSNLSELDIRFNQIRPQISKKINGFNKTRKRWLLVMILLFIVTVSVLGYIYFFKNLGQLFTNYPYAILILIGILLILVLIPSHFAHTLKKELNPMIANLYPDNNISYMIHNHTVRVAQSLFGFELFPSSGLSDKSKGLNIYDIVKLFYSNSEFVKTEESFKGTHLGYSFTAADIYSWDEVKTQSTYTSGGRLRTRQITQVIPLFRGIVVEIISSKSDTDQIVLMRNGGTPPSGGLEQIKLEDVEFEKLYDIYGQDQILARKLLTPKMMENILQMANSIYSNSPKLGLTSGNAPQMALLRNRFYILINNPNPFELNPVMSIFKEINIETIRKSIERVFYEIMPILKTIEFLKEQNFI